MKKDKVLAVGMSAVLACTGVALAAGSTPAETVQDKNDAVQQPIQTTMPETNSSFRLASMATVNKIELDDNLSGSLLITTDEGQQIQLNLNEQTKVVDNQTGLSVKVQDIQQGSKIFAYYSSAMTRSLPPQSACELILVNVGEENMLASLHEVGTVTKDDHGVTTVLTQAGDMMIRMDEKTTFTALDSKNIVTVADLTEGTRFLAWYDMVAMSYPGQAATEKVVILPAIAEPKDESLQGTTENPLEQQGAETADQGQAQGVDDMATVLGITVNGKVLDGNGVLLHQKPVVPVRVVAEALGYEVSYAQKDGKEFVTLQNDTRTMTLEIGLDRYVSESKMEGNAEMTSRTQYGLAPYIDQNITYVPADMFKSLDGFDVSFQDDMITVTAQK